MRIIDVFLVQHEKTQKLQCHVWSFLFTKHGQTHVWHWHAVADAFRLLALQLQQHCRHFLTATVWNPQTGSHRIVTVCLGSLAQAKHNDAHFLRNAIGMMICFMFVPLAVDVQQPNSYNCQVLPGSPLPTMAMDGDNSTVGEPEKHDEKDTEENVPEEEQDNKKRKLGKQPNDAKKAVPKNQAKAKAKPCTKPRLKQVGKAKAQGTRAKVSQRIQ